ncbi:unnamed protein product [Musa acuminata var. zebrina]
MLYLKPLMLHDHTNLSERNSELEMHSLSGHTPPYQTMQVSAERNSLFPLWLGVQVSAISTVSSTKSTSQTKSFELERAACDIRYGCLCSSCVCTDHVVWC